MNFYEDKKSEKLVMEGMAWKRAAVGGSSFGGS
jgi:hypothetical protein